MKKESQLKILCGLAMALALALMIGEAIRSWGMGRPFIAWFDDYILGLVLILGAYKTWKSPKNIKYLTAGWGMSFAALSMSYSGKMLNPSKDLHSNLSFNILTSLLLLAFTVSFVGLIWSLIVDFSEVKQKHHDN